MVDFDFDAVLLVFLAIEHEPSGATSKPTDFWSVLGFSRSLPDSVIRDRLKQNGVRYDHCYNYMNVCIQDIFMRVI